MHCTAPRKQMVTKYYLSYMSLGLILCISFVLSNTHTHTYNLSDSLWGYLSLSFSVVSSFLLLLLSLPELINLTGERERSPWACVLTQCINKEVTESWKEHVSENEDRSYVVDSRSLVPTKKNPFRLVLAIGMASSHLPVQPPSYIYTHTHPKSPIFLAQLVDTTTPKVESGFPL